MEIAFFDTHQFDREVFEKAQSAFNHRIVFFEPRLTAQTAKLAAGFPCVCCFVNDSLDGEALAILRAQGVQLIAFRSAGTNNIDSPEAAKLGLKVVRVPAYSPHAVAEHAVGLVLCLVRKLHRSYERARELNFSLDGLVGFDLFGKTIGVVGSGKIGSVFALIMAGFGCGILINDIAPDPFLARDARVRYVSLPELYRDSDVISLHIPLTPETHHLIDRAALAQMKRSVILINTGRGALIDTRALIDALKKGQVGAAGLDVYEEEEQIFFRDLSGLVLQDDVLARLLTFPNVVITAHQGFLTREALESIAQTTLQNISDFENGKPLINEVKPRTNAPPPQESG